MEIINIIKSAKNILIVGHSKPDGDCLGSGLTMHYVCKNLGKNVDFVSDSPLPQHFSFLKNFDIVNVQTCSNYDLVITVDCADSMRMGKYAGYLKSAPKSINIDHHKTNDNFALVNIVERQASSTCEVIFKILEKEGKMDSSIAYWLFVGLSTDTGHFMHNNTTAEIFGIAKRLCEYGVVPNEITNHIYKSQTFNKVKLVARAIDSMRFFADNKICIITITLQDLSDCGCVLADTEGLIDHAISINTVEAAVCITEQNRPLYKASFRSKSIDVSLSAASFGGGGHTFAAGCVVSGYYEDVISKLVKSITDVMP